MMRSKACLSSTTPSPEQTLQHLQATTSPTAKSKHTMATQPTDSSMSMHQDEKTTRNLSLTNLPDEYEITEKPSFPRSAQSHETHYPYLETLLTLNNHRIHLSLFDILEANNDPETTVCLGLTCKQFYPMFTARYPKTPLVRSCKKCKVNLDAPFRAVLSSLAIEINPCDTCKDEWRNYVNLHVLLRDWMPKSLVSGEQVGVR
jgi:hypothetical protein